MFSLSGAKLMETTAPVTEAVLNSFATSAKVMGGQLITSGASTPLGFKIAFLRGDCTVQIFSLSTGEKPQHDLPESAGLPPVRMMYTLSGGVGFEAAITH